MSGGGERGLTNLPFEGGGVQSGRGKSHSVHQVWAENYCFEGKSEINAHVPGSVWM